jgi:hypothetical protein
MMNLEWLAAVLAPRDVALHPNFFDPSVVTAPAYLGSIVHRRLQYLHLENEVRDQIVSGFTTLERQLLDAAEAALSYVNAAQGARELLRVATEAFEVDEAMAAAAALIASVSLAEQDEHALLLELVNGLRSRLASASVDGFLVRSALDMQAAMRSVEIGDSGVDKAESTLATLSSLRPQDLTVFPTSLGVDWDSEHTCERIIDELRYVAETHLASATPFEGKWESIIKREAPMLLLEASRATLDGYTSSTQAAFDSTTLSTTVSWRSVDPVDPPIWTALLHFELTGNHAWAKTWRRQLGELRLLRPIDNGNDLHQGDALQLLRHSEDSKSFGQALGHIRANGPLASLGHEVRLVLAKRLSPALLREVELRALIAGAQVLTKDEASTALNSMIVALGSDAPPSPGHFQHIGGRVEKVLDAAIALAPVAERWDSLALEILKTVPLGESDYIVQRAYANGISNLDWSEVTDETKLAWRSWLSTSAPGEQILSAVQGALGIDAPLQGAEVRLTAIADRLNALIRNDLEVLPEAELRDAVNVVTTALTKTVSEARLGQFSMGGVSAADIATGLAIYAGVDSLWDPLISFLLDGIVGRDDKAPALARLVTESSAVPEQARTQLQAGIGILLAQGGSSMFSNMIEPFPEAVRLAAALNLLPSKRLIVEILRLTGSQDVKARIEGARCLSAAATSTPMPEPWVIAIALQMSRDPDANVRANAGQALALLAGEQGGSLDLILERLTELMEEDGIAGPLLVLRGLSEIRTSLPSDVVRVISNLADEHPVHGVRLQALAILHEQAQR